MDRRTDLDVFGNDELLLLIKGNIQGLVWHLFTRFILRNVDTDSIENILIPSEELTASNKKNYFYDTQILDNQESTAKAEINYCFKNVYMHA